MTGPSTPLTDRQQRIAALIADGFSDKEIAQLELVDEETVGYHVGRIAKAWNLNPKRNLRVQITRTLLASESPTRTDSAA